MSKASLGIELSKLKVFTNPKIKSEQYPTDSEIAATILWNAKLLGDIENKSIADLGCGTGILGIGGLILGAKKVFFADNDTDALDLCRENLENFEYNNFLIIQKDINDLDFKVDVVLENPPFGTKIKHADKKFLEKAITMGKIVYTIHKASTVKFLEAFTKDNNCRITHSWKFSLPLKKSYKFHLKKLFRAEVLCIRIEVN